jgi:ABC-2 type transport system permease protein
MKKFWWVAKKDLLVQIKDFGGLIFLFIVPVAVMIVVGFTIGSGFAGNSDAPLKIKMPIVDLDQSPQSQGLISAFKQVPILVIEEMKDEQAARKLVEDHNRGGAVIIPAGFGKAVTSSDQTKTQVVMLSDPGDRTQAAILQNITTGLVDRYLFNIAAVSATIAEVGRTTNPSTIDYNAVAARTIDQVTQSLNNPVITVKQESTTPLKINTFEQLVPGYAIMFILFGISAAAGTILQEKESGTLRRLLTAPVNKWSLLGGKLLAQFLIALAQLVIMFVIGIVFFGLRVNNFFILTLIMVATVFSATAFGMLLVSIVKTRVQLNSISTVVVLTFSALGGSWFPLFLMPEWVQGVSRVTLTSWAMQSFNDLIIFGYGWERILPSLGILFLYGIICFLIGIRLFRFKSA